MIICCDSLKINWTEEFDVDSFSLIIGNPPYVNPHDINKETVQFLKKSFITTQSGVFNIFYAFIEKGLNYLEEDGILSFIIPNNFLTIKSASELRRLLQTRACIRRILDFGHNMLFKPVRTYNCIISIYCKKSIFF
ncbi:MAG: Eco57I restriction-modification methylase domain-containing protein [Lachnospiraceae bacterium]|nr:Eco57I restriction-modification methylase domain-containing protein [Lachnospiraceae bacterium]